MQQFDVMKQFKLQVIRLWCWNWWCM